MIITVTCLEYHSEWLYRWCVSIEGWCLVQKIEFHTQVVGYAMEKEGGGAVILRLTSAQYFSGMPAALNRRRGVQSNKQDLLTHVSK